MKMTQANSNTSFIDLLFLCLFGVLFLFFLAFLLIMPPIDDQQKKPKAEFLITLTWNIGTDDDVDLWIQDPADNIMFFREKNLGLMHLDHDDIGVTRDIVMLDGQQILNPINQEIATIRGFVPGEWVINIHMYAKRHPKTANVNVRVDKLNPRFHTLVDKNYIMENKGDEFTVVRLTMTAKGEITQQDDLFESLAMKKLINTGGSP